MACAASCAWKNTWHAVSEVVPAARFQLLKMAESPCCVCAWKDPYFLLRQCILTGHLDNGSIESRLATLLDDLCRAEKECGRKTHDTRLLAISKTRTIEEIYAAHKAGQTAFGESYVQEALPKILAPELERLEWHFIGPIQSNKAAKIARHFSWVQQCGAHKNR